MSTPSNESESGREPPTHQTIQARFPNAIGCRVARLLPGTTILVVDLDPRANPEPVPPRGKWVAPEPYPVVLTGKERVDGFWVLRTDKGDVGTNLSGLRVVAVLPSAPETKQGGEDA